MSAPPRHTIHSKHHHWCWNNSLPPALTVRPGDEVSVATVESSGGQIDEHSTSEDVANLDFERINPVTGPVYVEEAQPGDALKVTVNEMTPSRTGWSAIVPDFGLLPDQFPEPFLKLWQYDAISAQSVAYSDVARVFLKPMVGAIGLAPAAPGDHDILPPRRVGGTMDIRDIGVGSTLYLPVEVSGGLLSFGDTHAAQGDGEVCGTGLESAIDMVVTIELIKHLDLKTPRLELPRPVTGHLDSHGYHVTIGVGPDLMQGARDAVKQMIDLLSSTHKLSPADAYLLCSLCADLRISEIVNQPNWVVSLYFPRKVFE